PPQDPRLLPYPTRFRSVAEVADPPGEPAAEVVGREVGAAEEPHRQPAQRREAGRARQRVGKTEVDPSGWALLGQAAPVHGPAARSEEHTSELQSRENLV